jgi:hypothetical protein
MGRDLSDRDPTVHSAIRYAPISVTRGAARDGKDPIAIAKEWRALADAKNLSLREVAISVSAFGVRGHTGPGRRRARPVGAQALPTASTSRRT